MEDAPPKTITGIMMLEPGSKSVTCPRGAWAKRRMDSERLIGRKNARVCA